MARDVSAGSQRLGRDDWVRAAVAALAEGGVDAVAVEPLASRLGATKGSFYWHFANRRELLEAALQAWEVAETEAVIAMVDGEQPVERLDALLSLVLRESGREEIQLALLSSRADPVVAATLERVTRRRVDYVAGLYEAGGLEAAAARSLAVTAVATYLGHVLLATTAPQALPTGSLWADHVERVGRLLTAPPPP